MEKDNKIQNKIVQTYAGDMAKVIEDDKSGLIKKIIYEEGKHEKEKMDLSPESQKNKLFMFFSFLFFSISLVTLIFFFFSEEVPTVPIEKQFTPLIFNDKSAFIEVKGLKREEIIQTVVNEIKRTEVKKGGIEGIYLTEDKKIIGLRRFFELIKGNFQPKVDPLLGDVFVGDNFLMGVVNEEIQSDPSAGKDFFILIKVRSVVDTFDALRAWEEKMFLDLKDFFWVDISSEIKYLFTKSFEDGVVENKNARILYDDGGKMVMMYIFANDNSIIITNAKNAGKEIMFRLSSTQIKK
ncbi:MAG: hypothetical protein WC735_03450 [Candidatus Paceibacterota bacterium]|jgi:hypothetical protein